MKVISLLILVQEITAFAAAVGEALAPCVPSSPGLMWWSPFFGPFWGWHGEGTAHLSLVLNDVLGPVSLKLLLASPNLCMMYPKGQPLLRRVLGLGAGEPRDLLLGRPHVPKGWAEPEMSLNFMEWHPARICLPATPPAHSQTHTLKLLSHLFTSPGNCFRNYSYCVLGKIHRSFLGKLRIFRDSASLYSQSSFFKNIQFSYYSLKKKKKYSFLVWARNTFFQADLFSFTFWQLHCKAKRQDSRAATAWTSGCLLSPRRLEPGFAQSTERSSLEQKRWSCGSVLLVQSGGLVRAIWFMQ